MSKFFDANYNITKMVTSNGEIQQLEINGKPVTMSGDLDNNKTATISVSEYTDPVEITPTSGKDGMKKATVTLVDFPIPSINYSTTKIPGFAFTDQSSDSADYIAIDSRGNFISEIEYLNTAIFIYSVNFNGSVTHVYRKDSSSEIPNVSIDVIYEDNQDFTVTDGTITLDSITYDVTEKELYLHNCMLSAGS